MLVTDVSAFLAAKPAAILAVHDLLSKYPTQVTAIWTAYETLLGRSLTDEEKGAIVGDLSNTLTQGELR